MKKLISYSAITALAAILLTSCGQNQQQGDTEVPLKVTYTIECSKDLLNLCDLVVTYKGDDGVNVIDTITANPADSASWSDWTKTVKTTTIPVKIGFNYTLVPKTDTLITDQPTALLTAKSTIIAEKIGVRKSIARLSENTINSNSSFFVDNWIMTEEVLNTKQNLATIIDIYNERQTYYREAGISNTCYSIKHSSQGSSLIVEKACWNDDATK